MNWHTLSKQAALPVGWDFPHQWVQHVSKTLRFVFPNKSPRQPGVVLPYHQGNDPLLEPCGDIISRDRKTFTFFLQANSSMYKVDLELHQPKGQIILIGRKCSPYIKDAGFMPEPIFTELFNGEVYEALIKVKQVVTSDKGCNSGNDHEEPVDEPAPYMDAPAPSRQPVFANRRNG